ncbi:MAG: hypothetical protein HQM04_14145 [Magnetococcales bacterium]|nr:hypothetical protein [Magnetococcales bacterium]
MAAFTASNERLVGQATKRQVVTNPKRDGIDLRKDSVG